MDDNLSQVRLNQVRPNEYRKIDAPVIIPRCEHEISRANISKNALRVLYRLKKVGYDAYLVGGGVRDLLLGREPKDFDIVTDALPEEIRKQFRNCRLIGRRFRLAHIYFGKEIVEVATFRAMHDEHQSGDRHIENGMIVRDNVYGTIEQDVWRRDFSVNALYYNIHDYSVLDYTGGLQDLERGCLRIIGDPLVRFKEDPVRMLRAVRFATKLGFKIHQDSETAIRSLGHLLESVPAARLFDEVLKLFMGGCAVQTFELLRHYRLFECLFPATEASLQAEVRSSPLTLIVQGLANTDQRVAQEQPVTPAFLFAVLLWGPMYDLWQHKVASGYGDYEAIQSASRSVISEQIKHVSIPRRFTSQMREIWSMQWRLRNRSGKRPLHIASHPRFRAAYDFMLLRVQAGEDELQGLCDWWTRFQEHDVDGKSEMIKAHSSASRSVRSRVRRRPERTRPPSRVS